MSRSRPRRSPAAMTARPATPPVRPGRPRRRDGPDRDRPGPSRSTCMRCRKPCRASSPTASTPTTATSSDRDPEARRRVGPARARGGPAASATGCSPRACPSPGWSWAGRRRSRSTRRSTSPASSCSPGTCVLHDAGYAAKFPDLPFTPAALLLTRVVSRPRPGRLCLDLGHKAVAADPVGRSPRPCSSCPRRTLGGQSEEHLVVETPDAASFPPGHAPPGDPDAHLPDAAPSIAGRLRDRGGRGRGRVGGHGAGPDLSRHLIQTLRSRSRSMDRRGQAPPGAGCRSGGASRRRGGGGRPGRPGRSGRARRRGRSDAPAAVVGDGR